MHGSTGEFQALSLEERKSLAEAWMVAGKREKLHVMIQVGGCSIQDAIKLAAHAEQIGADSILSLPELYFKPTKPEQLIDYMQQIAKAAPNTPLFYYHVPMWSNVTSKHLSIMSRPHVQCKCQHRTVSSSGSCF